MSTRWHYALLLPRRFTRQNLVIQWGKTMAFGGESWSCAHTHTGRAWIQWHMWEVTSAQNELMQPSHWAGLRSLRACSQVLPLWPPSPPQHTHFSFILLLHVQHGVFGKNYRACANRGGKHACRSPNSLRRTFYQSGDHYRALVAAPFLIRSTFLAKLMAF